MVQNYGNQAPYGNLPYKGEEYEPNRINAADGDCIRFSTSESRGLGWSEYLGSGWLWPHPNIQPITVIYTDNKPYLLVLNEDDGMFYTLTTDGFLDKNTPNYGGQEIPWEVKLKEHTGQEEYMELEHLESHAYLRPYDEADKNTEGHDSNGYRDAQEIDTGIFSEGDLTESARTIDIPNNADIAFDRKVTGRRLQIGYSGTASSFKFVASGQTYVMKNKRGFPVEREMSENTWQNDFMDYYLWITRGYDLTLDRADGVNASGNIFGNTTGPDGLAGSAMVFSPVNGLTKSISNLTSDFSISFAISNISSNTQILSIATGNFSISISISGGTYSLVVNDNGTIYTQNLVWNGQGWATLQIVRDNFSFIIRENGVQRGISLIGGLLTTIGGVATIMSAQTGSLFDLRINAKSISAPAFLYYYNDVTRNNGNSLLPL